MSNVLVESRNAREKVLGNEKSLEVFESVKEITLLGDEEVKLVDGVAKYYDVPKTNVDTLIENHKEEFLDDGMFLLKGDDLREFKGDALKMHKLYDDYKYAKKLRILPKRSVLRIGMMLRDSQVAKTIRDYLLNIESISTEEQKKWAIERALGKQKRRELTDALKESGEDERMKGFAYPTYTNMIYRLVLGMSAKKYKNMHDIEGNLRNNLNGKQLNIIKTLEDIAKAQLDLGFKYDEVKEIIELNYRRYEEKFLLSD